MVGVTGPVGAAAEQGAPVTGLSFSIYVDVITGTET